MISILDAVLLGIVEGLTELLPVSSTGHLILLSEVLGHEGEAADSLDVVIQLGAVIAVGVYFRERIRATLRGLLSGQGEALRLVAAITAAFIPTAVVGLLFHKWVKEHLFAPIPVAAALAVGGVLMIGVERWAKDKEAKRSLGSVTVRMGFAIGLCQCLALWPGASRSMTTIVGGRLLGLDTKTSAEFSFLLALPTLGAATVYDFYKNGHLILAMPSGKAVLAVGLGVSFAVTWLVVALFLRYVGRVGLSPFGIYRIVLAAVVVAIHPNDARAGDFVVKTLPAIAEYGQRVSDGEKPSCDGDGLDDIDEDLAHQEPAHEPDRATIGPFDPDPDEELADALAARADESSLHAQSKKSQDAEPDQHRIAHVGRQDEHQGWPAENEPIQKPCEESKTAGGELARRAFPRDDNGLVSDGWRVRIGVVEHRTSRTPFRT